MVSNHARQNQRVQYHGLRQFYPRPSPVLIEVPQEAAA